MLSIYLLKKSSGAQWYQFSKSILHLRGDFKNGVEKTKPSSDVQPVRIGIFLSNKPSFMACSKGMGINGSFDSGSKLGFHCSGFGTSQSLKRVVPSTIVLADNSFNIFNNFSSLTSFVCLDFFLNKCLAKARP